MIFQNIDFHNVSELTEKEDGGFIIDLAGDNVNAKDNQLYQTIDTLANKVAWLQLSPLTGRTHQLRVHCADVLKTPIIGDTKYGKRNSLAGQIPGQMYLHAHSISWTDENGKDKTVTAPTPDYFKTAFNEFGFDEKQPIEKLLKTKRRKK